MVSEGLHEDTGGNLVLPQGLLILPQEGLGWTPSDYRGTEVGETMTCKRFSRCCVTFTGTLWPSEATWLRPVSKGKALQSYRAQGKEKSRGFNAISLHRESEDEGQGRAARALRWG